LRFNYELIRVLRENKLKISRQEFCRRLFVSSGEVVALTLTRLSRLEKGYHNRINPQELGFICDILEVTPNDLYELKNE